MKLCIPTSIGIEAVTREELYELGYSNIKLQNGRVLLDGDWNDVARLNIQLRTAERVQIVLDSFPCNDFDELFSKMKALDIKSFIPSEGAFPVTARSQNSKLTNVPAIQRTVKKALVDNLLSAHKVNELPETGPQFPIHCSILRNEALITLDTTGPGGLHRRGYRQKAGLAPLNETLAATMVLLSDWDGTCPLIDPCCGSGTILIEAALRQQGIPPGAKRDFLFEKWKVIDAQKLFQLRNERFSPTGENPLLIGSDISSEVLDAAKENAERAGVAHLIQFKKESVSEIKAPANAVIISNPPYGERFSDEEMIKVVYSGFKRLSKEVKSMYLLTSDEKIEAGLKLKAGLKRKLSNGGMKVTLYKF